MKKEDLVYLVYNDTGHVILEEKEPDNCEVNIEKGISSLHGRIYNIGTEMRRCEYGCRWGVIGVYDRTNLGHLVAMLEHAKEAVRQQGCVLDD